MNFTGSKAQVSFEFVLVLATILFLSSAIMMDFFNEANITMIAGQTKNAFEAAVGTLAIADNACMGTYLKSFTVEDKTFYATVIGPCHPKDAEIARDIERKLCSQPGNLNNVVECPPYQYIIKMIWKEKVEA